MPEKPDKIRPAVLGGLTIAMLSTIPLINLVNCFCCAGVLAGGYVAVHFYNKSLSEINGMALTHNDGIVLGLMSGASGAVIGTLFSTLIGTNLKQQIDKMMDYSENFPPEMEEALYQLAETQSDVALITIGLIMSLVVYCIFGMLGGLLAVTLINKKKVT